mmetsp:Transcript_1448/g.2481  ORF Transcript_1448/g.2481 Transcript_1448/m.2481 type:complete len:235 (+) Transcript_1448:189-893(+)
MGGDEHRCVHDTDAALSLCALGRLTCNESSHRECILSNEIKPFPSTSVTIDLPTPGMAERNAVVTPIIQNRVVDQRVGLLPKKARGEEEEEAAASRKNTMKPKDPKRDTSVTFEEMKRLMRVYGPIKALRNRASKDTGKAAKPESIRRKFYRWFPDFAERFAKASEGWFMPNAGHEQEMQYRESMRKIDQDILVKKRNDKRYSYRGARQSGNYAVAGYGMPSPYISYNIMDKRI